MRVSVLSLWRRGLSISSGDHQARLHRRLLADIASGTENFIALLTVRGQKSHSTRSLQEGHQLDWLSLRPDARELDDFRPLFGFIRD